MLPKCGTHTPQPANKNAIKEHLSAIALRAFCVILLPFLYNCTAVLSATANKVFNQTGDQGKQVGHPVDQPRVPASTHSRHGKLGRSIC